MVSTILCYDDSFTLEASGKYALMIFCPSQALCLLVFSCILKLDPNWNLIYILIRIRILWGWMKKVKSGDSKETELSLLLTFFTQPHQIFKDELSHCIMANLVIFYLVTSIPYLILQFFNIHKKVDSFSIF